MTNREADLLAAGWKGRPCFVVGGGPSLRDFDFELLRGALSIGANRAFEFFSPTILLAIDARFYRWVYEGKYGEDALRKLAAFKGKKVGVRMSAAHVPGVVEIKSLGVKGPIVPIEQGLYHGNNSGYSAVALALALGADPVYVLGVDLRYAGPEGAKVSHFHTGHPERTLERELRNKCLPPFVELSKTKEGRRVKIVNPEAGPVFSLLGDYFQVVPFPGRPSAPWKFNLERFYAVRDFTRRLLRRPGGTI
jgi:hypothetical protein